MSADLNRAKLRHADLRKADLTEANLSGADLTEAHAGGAELFRADLRSAILLSRADFGRQIFRQAERGADFHGAGNEDHHPSRDKSRGVLISGVDLSTALLPRGYKKVEAAKS